MPWRVHGDFLFVVCVDALTVTQIWEGARGFYEILVTCILGNPSTFGPTFVLNFFPVILAI